MLCWACSVPGIEPRSPPLQADSLPIEPSWTPQNRDTTHHVHHFILNLTHRVHRIDAENKQSSLGHQMQWSQLLENSFLNPELSYFQTRLLLSQGSPLARRNHSPFRRARRGEWALRSGLGFRDKIRAFLGQLGSEKEAPPSLRHGWRRASPSGNKSLVGKLAPFGFHFILLYY